MRNVSQDAIVASEGLLDDRNYRWLYGSPRQTRWWKPAGGHCCWGSTPHVHQHGPSQFLSWSSLLWDPGNVPPWVPVQAWWTGVSCPGTTGIHLPAMYIGCHENWHQADQNRMRIRCLFWGHGHWQVIVCLATKFCWINLRFSWPLYLSLWKKSDLWHVFQYEHKHTYFIYTWNLSNIRN